MLVRSDFMPILLIIVVVIILILLVRCLRIVPQAYVYVVERLGAYHASWGTAFTLQCLLLIGYQRKLI